MFEINRERAVDYLNTQKRLYVVDGFAGWDAAFYMPLSNEASARIDAAELQLKTKMQHHPKSVPPG